MRNLRLLGQGQSKMLPGESGTRPRQTGSGRRERTVFWISKDNTQMDQEGKNDGQERQQRLQEYAVRRRVCWKEHRVVRLQRSLNEKWDFEDGCHRRSHHCQPMGRSVTSQCSIRETQMLPSRKWQLSVVKFEVLSLFQLSSDKKNNFIAVLILCAHHYPFMPKAAFW